MPGITKESLHEQVDRTHDYHRPGYQETMDNMAQIRQLCKKLGHRMIDLCPISRELSTALTELDYVGMLAIAALARHEEEPEGGGTPNATSNPSPDASYEDIWNASGVSPEAKEAVIKSKFMREYGATPAEAQSFWDEMVSINNHAFVMP